MKISNVEQGTPEWKALRLGIPTASDFDKLITPTRKPREGEGRITYLLEKLAERALGYSQDELKPQGSWAMDQGQIVEKIARPWFEFTYDTKVQTVGFCTTDDGKIGCSPDGLIGEDGGIEIKSPQPGNHLKYLFAGNEVPRDYLAQVHGSMYVTGRKWWTFVSYSRQFPCLVVRVARDEAWIAALDTVLRSFVADLDSATARLKELTEKGCV